MSASTRVRALPRPPYYAAIFTSRRNDLDPDGYVDARTRMTDSAASQRGFLGMDSARDSDGFGIAVSYWESEQAIRAWREGGQRGVRLDAAAKDWFDDYDLKIARVERAYEWTRHE